ADATPRMYHMTSRSLAEMNMASKALTIPATSTPTVATTTRQICTRIDAPRRKRNKARVKAPMRTAHSSIQPRMVNISVACMSTFSCVGGQPLAGPALEGSGVETVSDSPNSLEQHWSCGVVLDLFAQAAHVDG